MKSILFFLCIIAGVANAQQMGTVVQAQPTFERVNVGSVCQAGGYQQQGGYQQGGRSNMGAILGGIGGAGIGNGIGQGDGRVAAMVVLSAVGAIVGDRLDNRDQPQQYQQAPCRAVPQYEQRQSGTQVVVDFEGRRVNGYIRRAVQVGDQVRVSVNIHIAE
jgi:uncharacterized protein YcfJ